MVLEAKLLKQIMGASEKGGRHWPHNPRFPTLKCLVD